MKIYYQLDDFTRLSSAVVTSGTFDGVHVGHQKIVRRLQQIAAATGGETVVITYWPHPQFVLNPANESLRLLNTFEEKAALLRAEGIQHLLRIDFTKEFSQITSKDFIDKILIKTIGTKKLVIGYDHRFGRNREGSFEQLRQNAPGYGFEVEEIPRQDIDHIAVSSSKIRKALSDADITTANHLLGRPYSITGRVVYGDQIGRTLGYPTANLEIDFPHKLIPADGIYAVRVAHANEILDGMLYIGNRPTLNGTQRVIEVNMFNFNRSIYGENLTVYFQAYLRGDQTFSGLDQLKEQLAVDQAQAIKTLQTLTFVPL